MAKKAATPDPRVATVDELVTLNETLAPHEEAIKRRETLKKAVRTWPEEDKTPAASAVSYAGTGGNLVVLGPRENQRKWRPGAIGAIFKLLGMEKFLGTCSVTLKAAEEALGPVKVAQLVTEDLTGSRDITVVKTAAA